MKKSRFTETQIVSILSEADAGLKVQEVCRKHGISPATYYKWKSKYGGLSASELKRIKELEAENAKLKRMHAELSLENDALKNLIEKNSEAVGAQGSRGISGGRTAFICSPCLRCGWSVAFGLVSQAPESPPARPRGHRRIAGLGGAARSLGILEMPGPPSPGRSAVESQANLPRVQRAGLEPAATDGEADYRPASPAAAGAGGAERGLVDRFYARHAVRGPPLSDLERAGRGSTRDSGYRGGHFPARGARGEGDGAIEGLARSPPRRSAVITVRNC